MHLCAAARVPAGAARPDAGFAPATADCACAPRQYVTPLQSVRDECAATASALPYEYEGMREQWVLPVRHAQE